MTEQAFLVDTNVWLERLLNQDKTREVGRFLQLTPSNRVFVTDFAFHSIILVMTRLKKKEGLLAFVKDAFVEGGVTLVHLRPEDVNGLVGLMDEFKLDLDDAYQYLAASKYDLTLVSFDSDFDRTERGRKTPGEALKT